MKALVLVGVAALAIGCSGSPDDDSAKPKGPPVLPKPGQPHPQMKAMAGGRHNPAPMDKASGPGGGGVAPIGSGGATGMTPVSGSDSVEGAGAGSVGAAAKGMAKKAAASESKSAAGDSATGGSPQSP